jgi:hypothetical protein
MPKSGPPSSGTAKAAPKSAAMPKPSASGPPSGMIPKSALPAKTGGAPKEPPSGPKKSEK